MGCPRYLLVADPAEYPAVARAPKRALVPPLRRGRIVRSFRETLRACRNRPGFRVARYSVQDDHAHFLIEAAGAWWLANGMGRLFDWTGTSKYCRDGGSHLDP